MLFFYDNCADYANLAHKYDAAVNVASIGTTTGTTGTNGTSLYFDNYSGNEGYVIKRFGVNRANAIFGTRLYPTGKAGLCIFADSTISNGTWTDTEQVDFRVNASGFIEAYRNTTLLGTAIGAMSFNAKHYVEFRVVIDPTAGQIEVRVDGVSVLTLAGINTRSSANSYFNTVIFGTIYKSGYGSAANYWSDIVALDNTGSGPDNTFLGDVQVKYNQPNGDGGTNQFTPQSAAWAASTRYQVNANIVDSNGNLQRCTQAGITNSTAPTWSTTVGGVVGDNQAQWTCMGSPAHYKYIGNVTYNKAANDGQSYLSDASVNDTELFNFPATSGVTVLAACVGFRAYKDQTSNRALRAVCSSSGTVVDSGSDITLTQAGILNSPSNGSNGTINSGSAVRGDAIFRTDPNTGTAWTLSGLNASKFGVKVSG